MTFLQRTSELLLASLSTLSSLDDQPSRCKRLLTTFRLAESTSAPIATTSRRVMGATLPLSDVLHGMC